jgi:mxaJ protein
MVEAERIEMARAGYGYRILQRGVLAAVLLMAPGYAYAGELRVCADPNDLPFSNDQGQGFENKIVALIAKQLGDHVSYVWHAQRRGFIRTTLSAGECDLVPGVADGVDMLRTTRPLFRSSFMFVTRKDGPTITSLDDPILRKLRIGVQLTGLDGANPPPADALAERGITQNVHGYMVYGDYRDANPSSNIMQAVAKGDIDVAVVWGPLAGYFATREGTALRLTFVKPEIDGPRLPMVFDVDMGVRWSDRDLFDQVDAAIVKLRPQINAILADYGVPRVDQPEPERASATP